jgi:hypothetical protein
MGMVSVSDHFTLSEFACNCRRTRPGCRGAICLPELADGLEALRDLAYPTGLLIMSGYRCPGHNVAVGGSRSSQHLHGAAADIPLAAELDDVIALRFFSGLGWQYVGRLGRRRKLVRHVDVRHASAHNPTGGSLRRPTLWQYP